jgi:hypothetical protein
MEVLPVMLGHTKMKKNKPDLPQEEIVSTTQTMWECPQQI